MVENVIFYPILQRQLTVNVWVDLLVSLPLLLPTVG